MKVEIQRTSARGTEKPHELAIWNEDNQAWEVETNTIADLLIFGTIVLIPMGAYPYECIIEIYDDYRE